MAALSSTNTCAINSIRIEKSFKPLSKRSRTNRGTKFLEKSTKRCRSNIMITYRSKSGFNWSKMGIKCSVTFLKTISRGQRALVPKTTMKRWNKKWARDQRAWLSDNHILRDLKRISKPWNSPRKRQSRISFQLDVMQEPWTTTSVSTKNLSKKWLRWPSEASLF